MNHFSTHYEPEPDQEQDTDYQEPVDLSSFDEDEAIASSALQQPGDEPPLSEEPLFSVLLRRAIASIWGDDPVMQSFVDLVAPSLSAHLGHVAAKGGDFAIEKAAEGVNTARYSHDQSMRAHLINGLLPALHVAATLQRWGTPQFTWYDDTTRRLTIAGYILHDWLKLPDVEAILQEKGLRHDQVNAAQHRPVVEELFRTWSSVLQLDRFLEPLGGLELWLHDLIFIACNTQLRWGTLRALVALPELRLPGRQRGLAENLSRLADYLAYLGRDPRGIATNDAIRRELTILSDGRASLVYHHIAELRGVLTNLIHNSALDAMRSEACIPLLYAPSGVVYLVQRDRISLPEPAAIADSVIARISDQTRQRLIVNLTGFKRDGKGIKFADYYSLFFGPLDLMALGLRATLTIINAGKSKKSVAGSRYAKLAGGWLDPAVDLELPDDVRVDQLAEWCFLVERISASYSAGKQVPRLLLHLLQLDDLHPDFLAVPRDARAGGVGYHWYFAAGHYVKRHPGLSPEAWTERLRAVLQALQERLASELPNAPAPASEFDDLRAYIGQFLTIGPTLVSAPATASSLFISELNRYTNAKRRGRGTTAMCSLCSSPFGVSEQREAAILFAPQVYSNKLPLHGTKAIRDICSICSLEMMLRQLLMSQSSSSGKNFEALNLRYLYLYPTYFFTPETLVVLNEVYRQLKQTSFTELRSQFTADQEGTLRLDPVTWQHLDSLLLNRADNPQARDRFLRLRFADNSPVTFFFLGVPPGRDAKDAEAWVHPAFLALLLPLCLDVKVVASASSLPLLHEASDLPQTVFLDGPHAAIRHLVHWERLNLDQLLPTLNRLAAAYLIHVDSNSRVGTSGFEYRWQDLPALARRLDESSLYVFWYLKKWQRGARLDVIPAPKAALYLQYQRIIDSGGSDEMSHARTLTELYRRFYRGSRWNANSILRPINVASKALLVADRRLFDRPALVELVRGELYSFVDRVQHGRADGYVPLIEVDGVKRPDMAAIDQFADYFVNTLFFDALKGDLSALRGRQLNLLKSACEVIYRDLARQERAQDGEAEGEESFSDAGSASVPN